jgi:3-methyladenine DNA glycosylase/8-oxoguanine DNA glycosylase
VSGAVERTLRTERPISLRLTLGPLRRGRTDPSMRAGPDGVWRATRTPQGPVTTHITAGTGCLRMRAWGDGAAWALDAFPALVGADDTDEALDGLALDPPPNHAIVADCRRRLPGLRIGRSQAVVEALVPTILEQKVVGIEAKRSYAQLVRALGEPAPGPAGLAGMRVPPSPATLAATPSYVFHRANVERKRADAIRVACTYAARLEETVGMAPADAFRRITALPGVGAWSAGEVGMVALGDPDAVSVGDYHLPNQVAWALAGEPKADDARMLELLEPYRGQRGRVIRLLLAGSTAGTPPRRAPRMPLRSIASI